MPKAHAAAAANEVEILFARLGGQVYEFNDPLRRVTVYWDATRGLELAKVSGREPVWIGLEEMGMTPDRIRSLYEGLDERYARTLHPLRFLDPLLFVPYHGQVVLADGWHRLFGAAAGGIDELPAYILTEEEKLEVQLLEVPWAAR